jgi:CHAD domain-containing protein
MAIEIDRLEKPLRKLRKALKSLSKDPPPEEVHKLRTRARHIESIAPALTSGKNKKTRRLIKSIKPVRKAAGSVRDMDVLTGNALTLPQNAHSESLLRLIEHLRETRQQSAGALLETVDEQRKSARRILKKYSRLVKEKGLESSPNGKQLGGKSISPDRAAKPARHVQAAILALTDELSHWPVLRESNIHPFRLKVKELRSILQLLSDSDAGLVRLLGETKDRIGDWHDWQQLSGFAHGALDAHQDRALLEQIDATGQRKLEEALAAANGLRKHRLQQRPGRQREKSRARKNETTP